jgi:hypothetical protein
MSGLEVLALVAGITSAFTGTASFLAERKKRKAEKACAKAEQLERLQTAVIAAPPQIQNEYDRDFARIGPKFATGDCEFLASIHPTFRHGQDAVYRQCIICWGKLGIVSKKMTKEDWLTHVNEHLTSGGFQLCRDTSGRQIRRAACTIRSCQKIHTRG